MLTGTHGREAKVATIEDCRQKITFTLGVFTPQPHLQKHNPTNQPQVCTEAYGLAPEVVVRGDMSARLPYLTSHLDYMVYELLKNAMRAVVERHRKAKYTTRSSNLPPIVVRAISRRGHVVFEVWLEVRHVTYCTAHYATHVCNMLSISHTMYAISCFVCGRRACALVVATSLSASATRVGASHTST